MTSDIVHFTVLEAKKGGFEGVASKTSSFVKETKSNKKTE